jgi:hypothetical protein
MKGKREHFVPWFILYGNGNDRRMGLIWERETRCGCEEEDSLVDNALDGLNDNR